LFKQPWTRGRETRYKGSPNAGENIFRTKREKESGDNRKKTKKLPALPPGTEIQPYTGTRPKTEESSYRFLRTGRTAARKRAGQRTTTHVGGMERGNLLRAEWAKKGSIA